MRSLLRHGFASHAGHLARDVAVGVAANSTGVIRVLGNASTAAVAVVAAPSFLTGAETLLLDAQHHWVDVVQRILLHIPDQQLPGPDLGHPEDYTLLRKSDWDNWVVFAVAFVAMMLVDNFVLHGQHQALSFSRACLHTLFWFCCAAVFCAYVYFSRGQQDAFDWATGYLLEWMLSVDNLFVFRSIFTVFKTPDDQKHKPLFWGICGAIFFRMGFFVIEELLVHQFMWMHVLLGLFLIYTGVKIVFTAEDENDDFEDSPIMRRVTKIFPFVNYYAPTALFFVKVPIDPQSGAVLAPRMPEPEGEPEEIPSKWCATRLFLVVICLEVTDIIFAVDSVSAIVAQIPDLYLAYTACVFAMLGLRATFFVVDEFVKLFVFLPYAVAFILVFLGIKLTLRTWFHVPPEVVCIILLSSIGLSIIGSLVYTRFREKTESETDTGGVECHVEGSTAN